MKCGAFIHSGLLGDITCGNPVPCKTHMKPFKHGEEGTHWACQARIKKERGKARCCTCVPHEDCGHNQDRKDLEKKVEKGAELVVEHYGEALRRLGKEEEGEHCDKCVPGDAGIYSGDVSCIVCPCHKPKDLKAENWEEEFDREFGREIKRLNKEGISTDLIFIKRFIYDALDRCRKEADTCKECGGHDMVCAKGVEEQKKHARKEAIEEYIEALPEEKPIRHFQANDDSIEVSPTGRHSCNFNCKPDEDEIGYNRALQEVKSNLKKL